MWQGDPAIHILWGFLTWSQLDTHLQTYTFAHSIYGMQHNCKEDKREGTIKIQQ
jgi:hypothetical protein